jgi:hypothetical protein
MLPTRVTAPHVKRRQHTLQCARSFPKRARSFPKEHGPDLPRAPQPKEIGATFRIILQVIVAFPCAEMDSSLEYL